MADPNNNNGDKVCSQKPILTKEDVKKEADIIKFNNDYKRKLRARAAANKRLERVFGINNAFTSETATTRQDATKKMQDAIKVDSVNWKDSTDDWSELRTAASDFVKEFLAESNDTINVVELTRFVTLKLSLVYLFPEARTAWNRPESTEYIKHIGKRINELWIDSKKPGDKTEWKDQKELHRALKAVTVPIETTSDPTKSESKTLKQPGLDPLDPNLNPLNLIIPAYETMWRVVMRGFLEISYRGAPNGAAWNEVLQHNLNKEGSFRIEVKNGVRALDIAREALRLYPPSGHIYRQDHEGEHVADIRACHHSELLAGKDPLSFRPERWQKIAQEFIGQTDEKKKMKTEEEELGFMPFAFVCPSDTRLTKAFGMKMIVLLMGVILNGLGDHWELENPNCFPSINKPLDQGRDAYLDLCLKKKME